MTDRDGQIDAWESVTPHPPRRLSAPLRGFVDTES